MGIIVLHGWATETDKWGPFLKEIKAELFKIPGLTQKINKPWTLDDYVEWLKKKIGKKIILIGHSNGGRIALAFTAKYPEKVEKLILIDSAGIYHNELPHRLKMFVFRTVAKIGKAITTSERLKVLLYKLAREGDYKNANPIQRQTMINLISTDLTPILPQIKVPTLIIWGRDDKTIPLSDGKLMHRLIKGSKLKIVDGRHSPQFTNAKEVAKIINEYL